MNTGHPSDQSLTNACPLSSDDERRKRAEETEGAPWTDYPPGNTPYVEYARMDALLDLQHPRTGLTTEYEFIVLSQVKELLFALLHHVLTEVAITIRDGRIDRALRVLRRVPSMQRVLLSCWEPLSVMTPAEFAEFRDVLGSASGFQSVSYRRLEFLLGNKQPAMVRPHKGSPQCHQVLDQLRGPSIYDEALGLLHRRGLGVPHEVLDRDVSLPYRPCEAVEAAWRRVYRSPDDHHDLHQLAEAMIEVSYLFARWRSDHLLTVQRLLGDKPGTGGTSGVAWLRSISEHRFFPELWSVRSSL